MHFAILYHEIGEKMIQTGDLYDFSHLVPEWEKGDYRDECKLIMNYMLNCKDAEEVISVIKKNRAKLFNALNKDKNITQHYYTHKENKSIKHHAILNGMHFDVPTSFVGKLYNGIKILVNSLINIK